MEITFKDLVAACPAAMAPNTEIFNLIKPRIDVALAPFLAHRGLMERLDSAEDNLSDPDHERLCALQRSIKTFVCTLAFYTDIPQLDLVLTPTGFGVVSNANVAPASADRVRELRVQLRRQFQKKLDEILDLMRPLVSLSDTPYFQTLFWKAGHVRGFGVADPTRDDLIERIPDIEDAANHICRHLSPELYAALLRAEASDSASPSQETLIVMWRQATVAFCRHDGSWEDCIAAMLSFVENSLDDFPEYRDSQTYKANHFKRYENQKDDSCFFFG